MNVRPSYLKMNNYLMNLRKNTRMNMMGAVPYVRREFAMDERKAAEVVVSWIMGSLDKESYEAIMER